MIQEDEIILCTVKRIEGTVVFLSVDDKTEGTMMFSEVSPGRIRNIREFVVPNKKVVCKVLRVKGNHIELSLRRVTGKEREEVMERYKKEKVLESVLKPILKEKTQEALEKIKEKYDISSFIDQVRENPSKLEEFVSKTEAQSLSKVLAEKKEKEKEAKKTIIIKSFSPSGVNDIKDTLSTDKVDIYYEGSSKFTLTSKAKDFKTANHKISQAIEEIQQKAKSHNLVLEVKEK